MAAVADGVSTCGSTNVPRADDIPLPPIPLPFMGVPTAASRVSPGSSPARSEASGGAACYAADAEPEPEASAGRSTQMLLAMAAMGGRGGQYGRRPASSYGSCAAWSAGSLTKHRPASPSPICSPVSSHGDGASDDPEPHGGDDASSFATPRLEEEQGRLPTRADFMKPSATPRNIKLQTPRHHSLPRRGANQLHPRFIHRATPARLMHRARSSHNYRHRVGAIDAVNEWRLPKVSEESHEEDDQDWQADNVSSRISSAPDWNFESDGPFEGGNHGGGAFDYSDGGIGPVAGQRKEIWFSNSVPKPKDNSVYAKLLDWKNAQVAKLTKKFEKKESDIDDWQKSKVEKAIEKMKETKMKLNMKMEQAGAKARKKIERAQREADKKKAKEKAAFDTEIDRVESKLKKMSRTGKLPWSMAFL